MQTSHFKAGEILMTYFWKHYCLMDKQNCVPHCLICHECHWEITPIDFTVMTLVCSCVTTECAVKHNHDEVTVWMEKVCSKFSIFVLFKKLAIWLTSLHLPTVHFWFYTSQEAEPKNRCGWGPSNKNMGVTFSWLAPNLTVSHKSTVWNSPVLFYRAPPLHNLKSVKHKLLRL